MTFEQLRHTRAWRPIPNCPGRFVLAGTDPVAPDALAGPGIAFHEFRLPAARDVVVVARIEGGGLISYRRSDGTCVHTLNTPEGFARKLQQLGIDEHALA